MDKGDYFFMQSNIFLAAYIVLEKNNGAALFGFMLWIVVWLIYEAKEIYSLRKKMKAADQAHQMMVENLKKLVNKHE